jgi:hypothetical protein
MRRPKSLRGDAKPKDWRNAPDGKRVASDFLIPNDWSADGRFLVYQNVQNGGPELDVLDLRKHSQIACGPGA